MNSARTAAPLILLVPALLGVEPLVFKAELELKAGHPRASADMFRQALKRNPTEVRAQLGYGRSLSTLGRCNTALEYMIPNMGDRSFDVNDGNAVVTCLARQGDIDGALDISRDLSAANPRNALLAFQVSTLLARVGRFEEAGVAAQEMSEQHPALGAAAELWLAHYSGDPDLDETLAWARQMTYGASDKQAKVAKLQVDTVDGLTWLRVGDAARAADTLRRVSDQSGVYPPALSGLAEAYRRMGDGELVDEILARDGVSQTGATLFEDVLVRRLADLGQLAEAEAALGASADLWTEDRLATRWYLATASGRLQEARDLEGWWAQLPGNRGARLQDLMPWSTGDTK